MESMEEPLLLGKNTSVTNGGLNSWPWVRTCLALDGTYFKNSVPLTINTVPLLLIESTVGQREPLLESYCP